MRTFIILAAIIITSAIYSVGGVEMPWEKGIGIAFILFFALMADVLERK